MRQRPAPTSRRAASIEAHLLGTVDYDRALALQQRLVYDASARVDGQISILLFEHTPALTIGRDGSRGHIAWDAAQIAARGLSPRFVGRGGGCLLHGSGQLAVHAIVPLEWHGWSVGEYLDRLQSGLALALADVGVRGTARGERRGLWGRSGQLVFVAAAVKNWVTYFGAYINVEPHMTSYRGLTTDGGDLTPASSLVLERQSPVRMTKVREAVVRRMSEAFGIERCHLYTGHPLLARVPCGANERVAHVG